MRIVLTTFIFLLSLSGFSQREAANWYFGNGAGLTFNSGEPVALLDGVIDALEGCAVISDGEGNLLFYTEGKTVWNRNHQVMPNGLGLNGSSSSTQAALIVPNPDDSTIYYIFTPDDALLSSSENFNGFNYAVVDMKLNNGLGDVVQKNNELLKQCSEKVSAIKNEEGNYYWVVTHFVNRFYAYRVDENGVDPNPVISQTGPFINDSENIRGTLKISPDGTKLALTNTILVPEYASSLFLFDFDANTGVINNPVDLSDTKLYYGIEFSPNSLRMYTSGLEVVERNGQKRIGNLKIVQYNLESTSYEEYVVTTFPNKGSVFVAGGLQLGMDKKIYHSVSNTKLSVIRAPNGLGLDIDFRPFSVGLGSRKSTYGLPQFIPSFFETIVEVANFCSGNKTTFTLDDTADIASVSWNFGDPNSGLANVSDELNPAHIFSGVGTYEVVLNVTYTNGFVKEYVEFVEIVESPNVSPSIMLVQCDDDVSNDGQTGFDLTQAIPLVSNGNENLTALFFKTEAEATANINGIDPKGYQSSFDGEIIYIRVFENSECFVISELTLSVPPMSYLDNYDAINICNGTLANFSTSFDLKEVFEPLVLDFVNYDQLSLHMTLEDALLENEALAPVTMSFDNAKPIELFFRVEESAQCAFVGRVRLNIFQEPDFKEELTEYLCKGAAVLSAPEGFLEYSWSNGMTGQTIVVDDVETVDVVFANGRCSYVQTFQVLPEPKIDVQEIAIEDFDRNNQVRVVLGANELVENTLFSIDGGVSFQNQDTFKNVLPGFYEITVDNGCSIYKEEIIVGGTPSFFTPNNDGFNDTWTLTNADFFPNYKISIFDRYGKFIKSFKDGQAGWDGKYENKNMPADDYWYYLELADGRNVKGFFTLKR